MASFCWLFWLVVQFLPCVEALNRLVPPKQLAEQDGMQLLQTESSVQVQQHTPLLDKGTYPSGSQIWNASRRWETIRQWHPAGVIANTRSFGAVRWANVPHMSLNVILLLSFVAYPVFFLVIIHVLTIAVSLCLWPAETENEAPCAVAYRPGFPLSAGDKKTTNSANGNLTANMLPMVTKDQLGPKSQRLYTYWANFCCAIPAMLVFGIPSILVAVSYSYPQEVFAILTLVSAAVIYTNSLHMVLFGGSAAVRLHRHLKDDHKALIHSSGDSAQSPSEKELEQVTHWVIIPQYGEDEDIISMTLDSIAVSGLAAKHFNIVLAMEEREAGSRQKAHDLQKRHANSFGEIIASFHPPNLPNDPAGKASNTAWAFNKLLEHLSDAGRDTSKIVLTVADADTEFHEGYFDGVSQLYLETPENKRNFRIWQSPIFHLKNYHRQPAPVIVGSVFTTVAELAALSDPNSVRFPYSTYSLSLELARNVGGWDPEWISEDWHMGIKCFLMTLGQTTVEPILLPTLNYTPEDPTWSGTVVARWTQAKRHALGFADAAYYFMTLPLIFTHCIQLSSKDGHVASMQACWNMTISGCTILIRLINVHVVIGVMVTYGMLSLALKVVMLMLLNEDRHIIFVFDRTNFFPCLIYSMSTLSMFCICILFICLYHTVKHRIETPKDGPHLVFRWNILHFCYTAASLSCFATLFFFMLGAAFWKAAWNVLTTKTQVYETAAKPSKELRDN